MRSLRHTCFACAWPALLLAGASTAAGQSPRAEEADDSIPASLRPAAPVSLFEPVWPPRHLPGDGSLRRYPLLEAEGPDRSSSFMTGLMATALTRAACGPNQVCRFYLEDAYEREMGDVPKRAERLGNLLGRALLPEFRKWGLSVGSYWWPDDRR